jgi:hypothetical protein
MAFLCEQLEARQLLAGSIELPRDDAGVLTPAAVVARAAPPAGLSMSAAAAAAAAAAAPQIDAPTVREELIRFVDTWTPGNWVSIGS